MACSQLNWHGRLPGANMRWTESSSYFKATSQSGLSLRIRCRLDVLGLEQSLPQI